MDTADLAPTEPTATLATPEEGGAPSTPTRRSVKLVVTLQPGEGQAYRAILALGADGCDPLLRCLEAQTLPAILAAVPTLLTEAEARWAVQPRYPTTTPSRARPRPAPNPSPASSPATEPGDAGVSSVAEAEPAQPAPAPAGQMSLFG